MTATLRHWQVYLMDFVDEFRRSRDPKWSGSRSILTGDENDALSLRRPKRYATS